MWVRADCVSVSDFQCNIKKCDNYSADFKYVFNYDEHKNSRLDSLNVKIDDEDVRAAWTVELFRGDDFWEWRSIKLIKGYNNFILESSCWITIQGDDNKFERQSYELDTSLPDIRCRKSGCITMSVSASIKPDWIDIDLKMYPAFGRSFSVDLYFDLGCASIGANSQKILSHSAVPESLKDKIRTELKPWSRFIKISGFEPKIFKLFLLYVYTGKIQTNDNGRLYKLYSSAKLNSMDALMNICERQVFSGVRVDNAVEILTNADRLNAQFLKRRTMDFIVKNKDEVAGTKGYEGMVKSGRIDLVSELFLHKSTNIFEQVLSF